MAWYQRHKVLSGALVGLAAGSVVPVIGNLVGVVIGAIVGPAVIDDEPYHLLSDELKEPGSNSPIGDE